MLSSICEIFGRGLSKSEMKRDESSLIPKVMFCSPAIQMKALIQNLIFGIQGVDIHFHRLSFSHFILATVANFVTKEKR